MENPSHAGDRALAFHRVQEARRELFEIRSEFPGLTPAERARLVVWYEAMLARAEHRLAEVSQESATPAAPSSGGETL
jgi:hypothetical protein